MALYATLRDYHFDDDADDIRGVNVFDGTQTECLGAVHDVVIDRDNGNIAFIVVTSGEREVMLPAQRVHLWGDAFVVDVSRPDFESLPSFDDSILNDADAWNQYQDELNEAWAKIGKPQPKEPLEMPRGVGMEPTLWERFCRRVHGELAEILRREGQIAARRKIYPRVG